MNRWKITLVLLIIFILGLVYIVWTGRAVNDLPEKQDDLAGSDYEFSWAEVEAHTTATDCWSVVGGQVYDLSSWVARHPGGAKPIVAMCGKDSTETFNMQHGSSDVAQAALILLKIGELK